MNLSPTHARYALPEIPIAGMLLFIYIYLPKYMIEHHGLSPALLGISLIIIKSVDLLLSPIAGSYINKFKLLGGRFIDIIRYSCIPLAISLLLLIALPTSDIIPKNYAFLFYMVIFILLWTTYNISYQALGLSIKGQKNETLDLFAFRDSASLAGTIATSGIMAITAGMALSETSQNSVISIFFSLLLLFSSYQLIKHFKNKEESHKWIAEKGSVIKAFKNKAFTNLSIFYLLTGFGSALSASLILIYIKYVLNTPREYANAYVFLFFLISLLSIPAWNWIAKRTEKKYALITAMFITSLSFSGVMFLTQGDEWIYALLISLSALGIGGCLIIPSAMQADICKIDRYIHHTPKEAFYCGLWSMIKKISSALAAGIAFYLLELAGFTGQGIQSEQVTQTITLLYAGVPFICYIGAIYIVFNYPISDSDLKLDEGKC